MNVSSFHLMQASRGPILLMTLGALVLIDYMGIAGFSRTWPMLIIVFGVMKLFEQVTKPPAPPPVSYPPAYPPAGYPPSGYGGPSGGGNAI
jgi:hypothetical protein